MGLLWSIEQSNPMTYEVIQVCCHFECLFNYFSSKQPYFTFQIISSTNVFMWRCRVSLFVVTLVNHWGDFSFLALGLLWSLLGVRDYQQITLVTLNGFCPLSKPPLLHLFLKDNIKMDKIPTKIIWKIHALSTMYFKFWRYFL